MNRSTLLVAGLISLFAASAHAQSAAAAQDRVTPHFKVQIWGETFVDFNTRLEAFSALRRELESGLPPLVTTDSPADIRKAVRVRAKRIRAARSNAREGDIFTPPISDSFRRALVEDLDLATCTAIMEDNPGEFAHHINGSHPEEEPRSTVPPHILAALPRLPDDVQYRFVGRHLVLLDTRSGVILDRIPFAIPCTE